MVYSLIENFFFKSLLNSVRCGKLYNAPNVLILEHIYVCEVNYIHQVENVISIHAKSAQ